MFVFQADIGSNTEDVVTGATPWQTAFFVSER
jgi:hypothetical protein